MNTTKEMLQFAKLFVKELGKTMKATGEQAKEMGLTREQTLHVWRRTFEITINGGGKTNQI